MTSKIVLKFYCFIYRKISNEFYYLKTIHNCLIYSSARENISLKLVLNQDISKLEIFQCQKKIKSVGNSSTKVIFFKLLFGRKLVITMSKLV